MALGCIWAEKRHIRQITSKLKALKARHNANGELKWVKVAPSYLDYYLEVVDWFAADSEIHFRVLIIPDKTLLDHVRFNDGSHDNFYYKSYFSLLSKILSPPDFYDIYLDVKDTRSRDKVHKLREVLCNDKFDFTGQMIHQVRSIRSHESQLMQICDFLLGAVTYRHRGLSASRAKSEVVQRLEEKLGRSLLQTTSLYESKFNVFVWRPRSITRQ